MSEANCIAFTTPSNPTPPHPATAPSNPSSARPV